MIKWTMVRHAAHVARIEVIRIAYEIVTRIRDQVATQYAGRYTQIRSSPVSCDL
jgi:hypothetical protein